MRPTHREYLGYRRADPTRQRLRECWFDKEPTTTNHHLLIGQKVSNRDAKGATFNISLHKTWSRRDHDKYPLLSGREGKLANQQALIHIG
jgi:hypothetical protein